MKKVSDIVAIFLKENGIKHVFGIIGSANSHIFDSIKNLGFTEIINVHHEQVAVMAMGAYYRASGNLSASLITAGGGAANSILIFELGNRKLVAGQEDLIIEVAKNFKK